MQCGGRGGGCALWDGERLGYVGGAVRFLCRGVVQISGDV
jgi:hypothetical protein